VALALAFGAALAPSALRATRLRAATSGSGPQQTERLEAFLARYPDDEAGQEALGHVRTWSRIDPAGGRRPPARGGHTLTTDSARSRVVLFGGASTQEGHSLGDTWEWDGVAWSEARVSPAPPARRGHAAAFDAARGRVVVFGGETPDDRELGDTWTFDGRGWEQQEGKGPGPRSGHAMAYDSARGVVVLHGGIQGERTRLGDTWIWNGERWREVLEQGAAPSPRCDHALASDRDRGGLVLFGGVGEPGLLGDTWTWDGEAWSEVRLERRPAPSAAHRMAYDPSRRRVVLFGGRSQVGAAAALETTWEWDGEAWGARRPAERPQARSGGGLAQEPFGRGLVLFGGRAPGRASLDDTWRYGAATGP
jgi:hypothetical protein